MNIFKSPETLEWGSESLGLSQNSLLIIYVALLTLLIAFQGCYLYIEDAVHQDLSSLF